MEAARPLRAVRSWEEAIPDPSPDEAAFEAILLSVGALGYEKTTVQEVLDRAGISRSRFQQRFGDKETCFAEAYEVTADRLYEDVVAVARKGRDWRTGFRAALAELLRSVAEQPLLARALLIEVRAARGRALAKHRQIAERLAKAVDAARLDPDATAPVTSLTAQFVVGAIEESICAEIAAGRTAQVERLLPDLAHLAVLSYFGEDEAWLELGSPKLTAVVEPTE